MRVESIRRRVGEDLEATAWELLGRVDATVGVSGVATGSLDAVLMYHSVGGVSGSEYAYDVSVDRFWAGIELVAEAFETVDLAELASPADHKRVAVTFDDAFRNVYENAVPVLRELEVPATVFASPELVDDHNPDLARRRHSLAESAREVAMTDDQLRELADDESFAVGNHTATHPNLADLDDRADVIGEVLGGKRLLEQRYGVEVDRFSYPYGAVDDRAARAVEAAHEVAVTSVPRLVRPDDDAHHLPRLDACRPPASLRLDVTDLGDRIKRTVRGRRDR